MRRPTKGNGSSRSSSSRTSSSERSLPSESLHLLHLARVELFCSFSTKSVRQALFEKGDEEGDEEDEGFLFSLSGNKEVVSKSAEIMAPMAAALVQVRGSAETQSSCSKSLHYTSQRSCFLI